MSSQGTPVLAGLDVVVLFVYAGGVLGLGLYMARRSDSVRGFMVAGGALPGWVVGLSLFGTFLSSNTFLGVPGKAYGSNWSSFTFSLSLPLAAWVATRWFVPFYRGGYASQGEVSAYHHLERRFGRWARIYALGCYLLTQLARVGSILVGVALALSALTGWSPVQIVLATGLLVTLYTLVGGIEAVIWTDVVQSVVLMVGALVVVGILLLGMPGGPGQLFTVADSVDRFSLGGFSADLTSATFWVVLLYGFFINLNNFGIDQSYVQRYHAARSDRAAGRSVWLAAWLYLPISALFFLIGSGLYSWYEVHSEQKRELVEQVAATWGSDILTLEGQALDVALGDRVFPHFLVEQLPTGVAGLLLAALVAAAMSSIDTSLNSSATVLLEDIVQPERRGSSERAQLGVLRLGTLGVGALGTGCALAMLGTTSVLDAWWVLSGIFAGGLLGLFLLGFLVPRARRPEAVLAVTVGVLVILWLTLSPRLAGGEWAWLASPLHANLTIVVGTLTIFLVGLLATRLRRARAASQMG